MSVGDIDYISTVDFMNHKNFGMRGWAPKQPGDVGEWARAIAPDKTTLFYALDMVRTNIHRENQARVLFNTDISLGSDFADIDTDITFGVTSSDATGSKMFRSIGPDIGQLAVFDENGAFCRADTITQAYYSTHKTPTDIDHRLSVYIEFDNTYNPNVVSGVFHMWITPRFPLENYQTDARKPTSRIGMKPEKDDEH